jgi:protein-S-isoprenylcysteine O-methyltransferase Ste14
MKKTAYFLYALVCYIIFFVTFLYLIGFVENISGLVPALPFKNWFPKTLDTGSSDFTVLPAILIDLLLIALFGLQHSVMARPGFKKKWTKIVPHAIERSTFVLFASIVLIILFIFWQPVNIVLWDLEQSLAGIVFLSLSFLGWVMLLISTFIINHFDLFGLRQAYKYARDEQISHISFRTPFFYRFIRHPIYLSFLVAFWFAPVMTLDHLVFNIGMTTYILIGIYHEERDLAKLFGQQYDHYRLRVPKLIPFSKSGRKMGLRSPESSLEGKTTA